MFNLLKLILLIILHFVALSSFSQVIESASFKSSKKILFKFDLKNEALTSAGVYKKDGTLLRTIWSGVKYKAGSDTAKWDGLDDLGQPVADSKIDIKVLTSNVKYEWEGAYIGNSSSAGSGDTRFRIFDDNGLQGVTSTGGKTYVASGYAEGWPAEFRFDTATANSKVWVGQTGITGSNTTFVATDGTKVYWAGFDPFQNTESFVFATNVSNDAEVTFSSGTNIHMEWDNTSNVTYNAISVKNEANAIVSGLAVQKVGDKLFISRSQQNELQVRNKTTGALLQTLTISGVTYLGMDNSDNLWAAHGSTLEKYKVNSDGTITTTGVTIKGIATIGGFGFSPNGTTIAVCDITNQVVKGYSTSAGILSWTLGTPGGYLSNSIVSNDKFYFRDVRITMPTYLHYLADGSFYVGDGANFRIQHYNADRSFKRSIMMLSTNYRSQVIKSQPTRLFSDYLEFEIDYTQALGATTGWKLKRNWRAKITSTYFSTYKIQNIITFSNGRTYGRLMINGVTYELVELVNNGVVRYTGIKLGQYGYLNEDGSKMVMENQSAYKKYTLTGYDVSNNPLWSGTGTYLSNVNAGTNDTKIYSNQYEYPVTQSGKLIYFNCSRIDNSIGNEYHLGAVNKGDTSYLWQTARGTQRSYGGEFPRDGAFDNGNGVESANRAGGSFSIYLNNIFWGYHGEFWKQSQTNIWNHVDGNSGLFVGQFGAIKKDFGMAEAPAAVAGNVFGGTVVEVNGIVYLYHNDEGVNNGVHRWKISGLSTVEIQTATRLKENIFLKQGVDLLEGITRNLSTLPNNFHGWTRVPESNSSGTNISVGNTSYDKFKPANLEFIFNQPKGNSATFSRDLGNNTKLNDWSLKGKMNYQYNRMSEFDLSAASFLDVVDGAGRQIARFDFRQSANQSGTYNLRGNNVVLSGGTTSKTVYASRGEDFEMNYSNGTITFRFSDYTATTKNKAEATADATNPKYFRFYAYNNGYQTSKYVSIQELRFFGAEEPGIYYKSISNGDWSNVATWQFSNNNKNWEPSTTLPDTSANSIIIKDGNNVVITTDVLTDNLVIETNATLNVKPGGMIRVNDGIGVDITILQGAKMIVQSDSTGTGIIGQSTGTITGDVEVQRYLPAKENAGYQLLAPSVNSNATINDNWQEGVHNTNTKHNINPAQGYGTHITGSVSGSNGFDASTTGQASLFTFNWQTNTPVWIPIANTNVNKLDAKSSYLLYVIGDRSIDLNNGPNQSGNTILRATGSVVTGTVNYSSLLNDGKNSAIANPYASPLNWNKLQEANSTQFENYYTMWDPNVGNKGGYVTVDATGIKSVRTSKATTDIQSGQAFIVKAKKGTTSANFVITEADKSRVNNPAVFRGATVTPKLYTSLYYVDNNTGKRNLADGILSRFDDTYLETVNGDDAEDISNFEENLSLSRNAKNLSIESRPLPKANDTLYLSMTNMKQQAYEWQFDASDFNTSASIHAFLIDSYLNTEIPVEIDGPTVVIFAVTSDPKSYRQDRFKVVFDQLKTLPLSLLSINATKYNNGVNVEWKTTNELNLDKYIVERSVDGQNFDKIAVVQPVGTFTSVNNYLWYDNNPVNTYNYYRIRSVNKDGTYEYTKTVRVLIDKQTGKLNVYPNPIPDKGFEVLVNNLPKGEYNFQLFNYVGQLMATKQVKHAGGDLKDHFETGIIIKGMYKFSIKSLNYSTTQNLIKL
ncbi:MAG: hypothetical protein LH478_05705 [Chitinophagaceae bacterium]|nr:hypothetical protein [Chitinophagaceae bacterium]